MANQYLNLDTLKYVLFDVHQIQQLQQYTRYEEIDREMISMLLDSVKDFSDRELFPVFREMDEQPAHFKDGGIVVHPVVKTVMEQAGEMGLIGGSFDLEDGGMQMPGVAMHAAYFIMEAANNNLSGYPGLTGGAADLIVTFGSQELKDTYVPNMLSGKWAGTMCLTEPQAGSSLSDVATTAYPQEDGTYKIKGQKIFISGGDHQYAENFIHLLLARIEGAPAGTKGISLFVVPKKRIREDGSLTPNDVKTAGDFQKMGQRGYCTTHLVFGEEDDCVGYLVGKPHNGLRYMFQMMNGARISVGSGATALATAAYHASLQYAKERPQGRRLQSSGGKDPSEQPCLIIEHPDVRRMLLLQKAIFEGSMALIFQASFYHDMEKVTEGAEKEKYHYLLELLTPVVKTYPSEKGRQAIDNGLQVLGGYGFCTDFVLQQYYRDIRIYSIYEGTTGIQSLDLLGRKITMDNGKALKYLVGEMQQTIGEAMTFDELKPYAKMLGEQMALTNEVLNFLMPFAMKGEYERFLSDASVFMEFFGNIIIAWQWLKMGVTAKNAQVTGQQPYSADFYEGIIHTLKFFYKYELPRNNGIAPILTDQEVLTIFEEKELIH